MKKGLPDCYVNSRRLISTLLHEQRAVIQDIKSRGESGRQPNIAICCVVQRANESNPDDLNAYYCIKLSEIETNLFVNCSDIR